MFNADADTLGALADDSAGVGFFLSLGIIGSGQTVAWERLSSLQIDATVDGISFPSNGCVASFVLPRSVAIEAGSDGSRAL